MTTIRYTKHRLKSNLKMGLYFTAIGGLFVMVSMVTIEWKDLSFYSIGLGHIAAGIIMLLVYYFESRKQYLTIENGALTKNTLFAKKLKLGKIKTIKEFAGDLKLISDNNVLVINTQYIEPKSLIKLKEELLKYKPIYKPRVN